MTFRDYAVLGDDLVIWNKSVAAEYETVMEELSVKINKSKTVTASRSDIRVEFAKRLFYQHIEISGMS